MTLDIGAGLSSYFFNFLASFISDDNNTERTNDDENTDEQQPMFEEITIDSDDVQVDDIKVEF